MSDTPTERFVLAFDVEDSGLTPIAIGASVVNDKFEEVAHFLGCCFKQHEVGFTYRVVKEFWMGDELRFYEKAAEAVKKGSPVPAPKETTNHAVLRQIADQTPSYILTQANAESKVINDFVDFCVYWEMKAVKCGGNLVRATDNSLFDPPLINNLLRKYRPDMPTLPCLLSTAEYVPIMDTYQQQLMLLSQDDPSWGITKLWGADAAVIAGWDVPARTKAHTHMPDSDAYTIAHDMQILLAIKEGRIKKKKQLPVTDQ